MTGSLVFQDLAAEAGPLENRRHVQDGVLGAAPAARVLGAQGLVGFEQRQDGEAEGVLHARSPVAVELAAEDAQGVGGGLIAIPAQAGVQQVDAERPASVRDVQVDDVGLAVRGTSPSAADARSRCGSTSTRPRPTAVSAVVPGIR